MIALAHKGPIKCYPDPWSVISRCKQTGGRFASKFTHKAVDRISSSCHWAEHLDFLLAKYTEIQLTLKVRWLCVLAQSFSHVWLFVTPWTVAHQAPLTMGFFRQEYWSGLPFPPSGDLPNPGIKHVSPGRFFTNELSGKPWGDCPRAWKPRSFNYLRGCLSQEARH